MVGKKFPGSVRDRVRQYMLNSDGKKVTRERMAKSLGIPEDKVMGAMSALIRHGEYFEAVERGKAWRLVNDDTPTTRKGNPNNDADVLFGERKGRRPEQDKRIAGMPEETVSESLTRTHQARRRMAGMRLEADILNITNRGSIIFQTDDSVVWIARKIDE